MKDLSVQLTNRPGELARVTNALSLAGVNLKSVTAMAFENHGTVRLIPDDLDAARNVFRENNIRFEETELAVVLLENRAGQLTDVAVKLGDAGVNLQAVYVVGLEGDLIELAVAADDPKTAKKVLE